ncbi:MAG: serine hydroxymethyltransferase [Patescibacteria group bacterium]|nr:serine hydroxymethyltransferase [Patescibacteria group bacterium]
MQYSSPNNNKFPPLSSVYRLLARAEEHELYRSNCLNMIASENLISPLARRMLSADFGNRYSYGAQGEKLFPGTGIMDEIEGIAAALAANLFHAGYVNVQPVSGMVANMVVYEAVLKPGATVLAASTRHGGHYSHHSGLLDRWNARVSYLPFDSRKYQLDIPACIKAIFREKPQLVIVGGSEMLFPVPLQPLRQACDRIGAVLLYDAAHVAGLIAGGEFQQPLAEGAHILTLSTNKSMAGPDHGLVATADPHRFRHAIERAVQKVFVSNNHMHHIAALAITLAENKVFGRQYAHQVLRNSRALGEALDKKGITVVAAENGWSKSHMVLVDTGEDATPKMRALERANIITSTCSLPKDRNGTESGLRLGTAELTRIGMREQEMEMVAECISSVLHDSHDTERTKKKVTSFRSSYRTISFCFSGIIDYN